MVNGTQISMMLMMNYDLTTNHTYPKNLRSIFQKPKYRSALL
ncbi:hypothetical protein BN8_03176 [Fibrisoma limi BUZ 3]|uniref:Uncharacterized protein n=1 Tax=Fibrisoma limi BUZ 3 TaxID=1185876 RepID=I2GJG1_9BACT|nr:hypothetical protein BN8_03176 [Fibrisoma limi BUZ 3]